MVLVSPRLTWTLAAVVAMAVGLTAQNGPVAGRNVNIVGGPTLVTLNPFDMLGDPARAQQNEASCGVSARHSQHILCGANDYRAVDLPGLDDAKVVGDAWAGVFQTRDGGLTWQSRLHPGFALDPHESPLKIFPAIADSVVRMGPGGVGYYSGIAFERGENGRGVLFVSTWMDLLAREGDPFPFKHVRTALVDAGNVAQFIDKPWMGLGKPVAGQTCSLEVPAGDGSVVTQTVPKTPIYVVWSTFVGQAGNDYTHIYFSQSLDCGVTFSHGKKLSAGNFKNQGAQLAVLPDTNTLFVAWRRGATTSAGDALVVTTSTDGGATFSHAIEVAAGSPVPQGNAAPVSARGGGPMRPHAAPHLFCPFDQGTTPFTFRTTGFPTLAAGGGRAYLLWAQRIGNCATGVARIVYSTSADGASWTEPAFVDSPQSLGHQIMPAASVAGDTLQVIWLDFRNDASGLFRPAIEERSIVEGFSPQPAKRHTADVRGAQATLGPALTFTPYPVSQYIFGVPSGQTQKVQLQHNPVNVRMFRKMTVPFIADYLDVASQLYAPADPVQAPGVWVANAGQLGDTPALAAWTDNRNVKLFANEDYSVPRPYTRPNLPGIGSTSIADPFQAVAPCVPGVSDIYTGSKNQDVFAAAILPRGWVAAAAWNNKPLGYSSVPLADGTYPLLQRAFAVYVRNITAAPRSFDLSIANQPPGGTASFDQFAALSAIQITVPARSMVARTVYVNAPSPRAAVAVDVNDANDPGSMRIWLNPDPSTPASLLLPESVPPDEPELDIANFEVYDISLSGSPTVTHTLLSPGLSNSGWPSPEWENPEWENPEWENPEWENPEWENPEWENPEWQNPEWENPEWENPEWENPEWENGALDPNDYDGTKAIKQFRWRVENQGNTTAAYNTKVAVLAPTGDFKFQLVVYKLYTSPVTTGCEPNLVGHTQVLSNVTNLDVSVNNFMNADWENTSAAHYTLEPGEEAYVVLQAVGTPQELATLDPEETIVGVQPQAVNTADVLNGVTEPPVEVSAPVILTSTLPNGVAGSAYPPTTLQAFGGTLPYAWSQMGGLPPGLSLHPTTGVISGTPTTSGIYNFTIVVADSSVPARSAARAFTITIDSPNLAFVVQPTDTGSRLVMSPDVKVFAQDDHGAVLPGVQIQLAIGQNPGDAVLSGTTTATTDAAGVATFTNLSVNHGGVGYTLVASAAGPVSVTSNPFTVVDPVGEVTDPTGDGDAAGNNDLVFARAEVIGDDIKFTVQLAPGTFDPNTTTLTIGLDTDQNVLTGHAGLDEHCSIDSGIIGVDYIVQFSSSAYGTTGLVYKHSGGCNSFTGPVMITGATFTADGGAISIPLAALGNDDGRLNFKVISTRYLGGGGWTGIIDVMPNVGSLPGKTQ
jgi:hypothetical protein